MRLAHSLGGKKLLEDSEEFFCTVCSLLAFQHVTCVLGGLTWASTELWSLIGDAKQEHLVAKFQRKILVMPSKNNYTDIRLLDPQKFSAIQYHNFLI